MTEKMCFAVKLAAFMLNQVDVVRFTEKGGFDSRGKEILGLLPFVHMNICKEDFSKMIKSGDKVVADKVKKECMKCGLNEKLSKLGFKCSTQSNDATDVLMERFVDTIDKAYNTRANGKKMMRKVATCMKWQAERGIIPKSSVEWCKSIKMDGDMKKKLG